MARLTSQIPLSPAFAAGFFSCDPYEETGATGKTDAPRSSPLSLFVHTQTLARKAPASAQHRADVPILHARRQDDIRARRRSHHPAQRQFHQVLERPAAKPMQTLPRFSQAATGTPRVHARLRPRRHAARSEPPGMALIESAGRTCVHDPKCKEEEKPVALDDRLLTINQLSAVLQCMPRDGGPYH